MHGSQRGPALAMWHGHQANLLGAGMSGCILTSRAMVQLVDVLRADLAGWILQREEGTEMLVCAAAFLFGSGGSIALHRVVLPANRTRCAAFSFSTQGCRKNDTATTRRYRPVQRPKAFTRGGDGVITEAAAARAEVSTLARSLVCRRMRPAAHRSV